MSQLLLSVMLAASMFEVPELREFPTFYCQCSQTSIRIGQPDCGYRPKRATVRSRRVEWEHVVPASTFGRTFAAWRGDRSCVTTSGEAYRGRRCARKVSAVFRAMESDPHNIVPAIGEINAVRGDRDYGIVPGEPRDFGTCDFEVKLHAEPAPSLRGDVARIYWYMAARWPGHVPMTAEFSEMLERWAATDPVDARECRRSRAVSRPLHYNHFVEQACVVLDARP